MKLKGKTAVITGASDGIGREIALKLAKEKVKLVLIARNEGRLNEVKKKAERLGSPKVKIYVYDLSLKQEVKDAFGSLSQDFKNIHILINNAGIWQKVGQLDEASVDDIEKVLNTNLMATVLITNLLLPTLRKSKHAAIVNISSRSGYLAQQGQSVYGASKWGITGFTEVLKQDLKGSNVRIATIHQAGTSTDMFNKADDPREIEKFTKPQDLADVVIYMLTRPTKIWLHDVRVEY